MVFSVATFPLTPSLSLGERVNHSPPPSKNPRLDLPDRRTNCRERTPVVPSP